MATALAHRIAIKGVQTVGAVNAVLATFAPANYSPIVNNVGIRCEGRLVGRDATPVAVSVLVKGVINVVAGAVGLEQSLAEAAIGNATLLAATGFFDVSVATTIRLNATGVAGSTITWSGYLDLWTT